MIIEGPISNESCDLIPANRKIPFTRFKEGQCFSQRRPVWDVIGDGSRSLFGDGSYAVLWTNGFKNRVKRLSILRSRDYRESLFTNEICSFDHVSWLDMLYLVQWDHDITNEEQLSKPL